MEQITIGQDNYYRIKDSNLLRPFFMSIVSDSNHWMFISSNGGLSAGRKNAQHAIFPYYTDDKLTESAESTGSKTIIKVKGSSSHAIWEPFSIRGHANYNITQNLYKSIYGNKIIFEELNNDLGLTFSYQWSSSNLYGFVRESALRNSGPSTVEVELLDGIQNILPYGVSSATQNRASNLVDAYKRTELVSDVGLAIYALSAIIVDKAEPSEALKANVVWSLGTKDTTLLLSSLQLDHFRKGRALCQETDIKGEKGAYFAHQEQVLAPNEVKKWVFVANVNQDHSDIVALCEALKNPKKMMGDLNADVARGTKRLIELNASSDALQCTSDPLKDTRHFSNTLFNIMRGGVFDDNYTIEREDLEKYLVNANKFVYQAHKETLSQLSQTFSLQELKKLATITIKDHDFERLCIEYLPLKFSRRHGDPSRPWNIFSINTHSEIDGSKILDYEGNWRDIFQNWEALAHAFPGFIDGMILKFFNASTFDGYNPYRITKGGFDWEVIEPDDPWSYIGYWGDHQIIYSLKFLEFIQKHYPKKLESYFDKDIFVYANVPYRIKSYQELLANPKDTIRFDTELDELIRRERMEMGADGALVKHRGGEIHRVNFMEKILASVLAKMANFIPGAGIWMNTQRPEWNDANNALVGNGVSMVTLCYLRRYLCFFEDIHAHANNGTIALSIELLDFFTAVNTTLSTNAHLLKRSISPKERKIVLDGLGNAASTYRLKVYTESFSGEKQHLPLKDLKAFIKNALAFLEHTIRANRRDDNLYHAYNLMTITKDGGVSISYLSQMLEGQVAALSSGHLNGKQALDTLDALKDSALFRKDQYSYMLYPNKELPPFLEKNTIPGHLVKKSALLSSLVENGNEQLVKKDVLGEVHFNGTFKNAADLLKGLESLDTSIHTVDKFEKDRVLEVFETVFDHKSFTGRSGTFFGYEGLGSIYWHMVSKLLLAVQECCSNAIDANESPEIVDGLLSHYYEIGEGIGVHKPPQLYGAFPTDPYSHTPAGKGVQQPGMTGQVKEDILSRFGELGVTIKKGQICFQPTLLRKNEFLGEEKVFTYVDLNMQHKELALQPNSLGFTYCQVPMVYKISDANNIEIIQRHEGKINIKGTMLDKTLSESIFHRKGEVLQVNVSINEKALR